MSANASEHSAIQFKGWTIPGPKRLPKGLNHYGTPHEAVEPLVKEVEDQVGEPVTLDGLSGHFKIFQLKQGHRYSTDDVLVAWYGTQACNTVSRHLDLGTGIGSVGMMVNWRLQGVQSLGIEAQEKSVKLCLRSLELNGIADRYLVKKGDLRNAKIDGILGPDDQFDLITSSPPYFHKDSGILGNHPQKVDCRFEMRGTVLDYAQLAANHLAPGGVFVTVFPIDPSFQKERVFLAAENAGLHIFRWRPISLKAGESPLLGVFAMIKKTDLPEDLRRETWCEPELIIRDEKGKVTPEYRCIKLSMGLPPTA